MGCCVWLRVRVRVSLYERGVPGETVQVGRMQGVWSSKSSSLLAPISNPKKPDAFGAQASKDSIIKTAALQASMQPQPAPTPQDMPFAGFVAQASHWFWLYIRLSTLRVVS